MTTVKETQEKVDERHPKEIFLANSKKADKKAKAKKGKK